jgi:hypothetical protein
VPEGAGKEVDVSASECKVVKSLSVLRTEDADEEEWDVLWEDKFYRKGGGKKNGSEGGASSGRSTPVVAAPSPSTAVGTTTTTTATTSSSISAPTPITTTIPIPPTATTSANNELEVENEVVVEAEVIEEEEDKLSPVEPAPTMSAKFSPSESKENREETAPDNEVSSNKAQSPHPSMMQATLKGDDSGAEEKGGDNNNNTRKATKATKAATPTNGNAGQQTLMSFWGKKE